MACAALGLTSQMIDEFEDVTEKEKSIMKLWNRFVKSFA
jgi:hypothetical protein